MITARQQNTLPKTLTGDYEIVRGSRGSMLKQCKAKVLAAILQPVFAHETRQFYIAAVTGLYVLAPARPDAKIAISRTYVSFTGMNIGDQINALYVLQGCLPIHSLVANDCFKFCKR